MALNWQTGKNGKMKLGSRELPVTKWSARESAKNVPMSNSLTSPYTDARAGLQTLSGSATVVYDSDSVPFDGTSPNRLRAGERPEVFLYENTTSGPGWYALLMNIFNVSHDVNIDGDMTCSFDFESSGAYSRI